MQWGIRTDGQERFREGIFEVMILVAEGNNLGWVRDEHFRSTEMLDGWEALRMLQMEEKEDTASWKCEWELYTGAAAGVGASVSQQVSKHSKIYQNNNQTWEALGGLWRHIYRAIVKCIFLTLTILLFLYSDAPKTASSFTIPNLLPGRRYTVNVIEISSEGENVILTTMPKTGWLLSGDISRAVLLHNP